ncbi:MAG: hypothetical protein HC809_13270 [Gammaproteobacteria bacterium]|nr:hypothetical protein [Gammaproteobacteria bacterium]
MIAHHAVEAIWIFLVQQHLEEVLTLQPIRGGEMVGDALCLRAAFTLELALLHIEICQRSADLGEFGVECADFPTGAGDGFVDLLDFALRGALLLLCIGKPRRQIIQPFGDALNLAAGAARILRGDHRLR